MREMSSSTAAARKSMRTEVEVSPISEQDLELVHCALYLAQPLGQSPYSGYSASLTWLGSFASAAVQPALLATSCGIRQPQEYTRIIRVHMMNRVARYTRVWGFVGFS